MFEGAVLLWGLVYPAAPQEEVGPGDGHVCWPQQCGALLAAADGRGASTAAATVDFQTTLGTTVTLRRLSEA